MWLASIGHHANSHRGKPLSVTRPLTIALAKPSSGAGKDASQSLFSATDKLIHSLVAKSHLLLGASCEAAQPGQIPVFSKQT